MQIVSLDIENIRSYPRGHFDFPLGIVMLSGDIGSGKSTVLLAIEFALFGLLRGEVSGATLLRNGALRGSVELEFSIGEHMYRIKRTLKRSRESVEQEAGYLLIDGVKTDGTASELKSKILELLGYPQEQLSKAKNLIYRYTLYTPQEEMKHILREGREERLALLRKVFDIDKYATIVQNANSYAKALRERKRALDIVLVDLQDKHKQAQVVEKELAQTKEDREKTEKELVALRAKVEQEKVKLADAEKKRAEAERVKAQEQALKARVGVQESQMFSQRKEIELLASQQQSIPDIPEKPKVSSQELSKGLSEKEKELRIHLSTFAQTNLLKQQSQQTINKVKSLAQCPMCLQEVSENHKLSIVKREQEKMYAAQEQETQMRAHVQQLETEIAQLRKDIEEVRKKEQEIGLAALKLSQAQAIVQRKNALEVQQTALNKEIKAQKILLAELEEKVKTVDGSQYERARKEAESVLSAERSASMVHAALVQKEEQIAKQLTSIQKEIEIKERGKKQLERTQAIHQWLTDYFVPLMEIMEKHVMARIHHAFDG